MRNVKSYISLGAITILLSLHAPFLTVAAPNDLVVEFESTPLFNQSNFLPTEDVTKFVKVTNNTVVSQPIAVEAINESAPDGLGSQLDLTIKEGATTLYSKTLAQFFSDGEIFLSNVAGNETQTQYDFTVAFHSDASNDYQGKTLGFDILIGFQGEGGGIEPQQTQGGGGTGGGGGVGISGLSILHESSVSTLPNELAAIINWITSYKSTSRVVYGTAPGVFDFYNLPNYGYPLSTAEFDTPANPNGVTAHQVTVTALTPNTTYYYRVISHASPPNISREYSFTTLGSTTGTPQQPAVTPAASTPPSSPQSSTPNQPSVGTPQLTNPTGGTVAQGIPQNSLPPSGITPTPISPETGEGVTTSPTPPTNETLPTGTPTPTAPSALGSLGAFLGLSSFNSQSFIILLLIAGLVIIFLLYRKKR